MRVGISLALQQPRRAGAVTPAGNPAVFLPTITSTSYLVANGPVQLIAAYGTGPLLRLRRASDNAEQDFAAQGAGTYTTLESQTIDAAAVRAWAGGGVNVFVVTAYDQTGNGHHCTQATTAQQPSWDETFAKGDLGTPINFDSVEVASGPKRLPIPNTVVVNRNSLGGFFIVQPMVSAANSSLFDFSSAGSNQFLLTQTIADGWCTVIGGPATTSLNSGATDKVRLRSMLSVVGYVSRVGGQVGYAKETSYTAAALASLSMTAGGAFGAASGSGSFNTRDLRWANILTAAAPDTTDAPAIRTALQTLCGDNIKVTGDFTSVFQMPGDSYAEDMDAAKTYSPFYQLGPLLNGTPELYNMGIGGETAATCCTQARWDLLIKPQLSATLPNVVLPWVGTNSLTSSVSGQAIYDSLTIFGAAALYDGANIGYCTMVDVTTLTGPQETERAAGNVLISADTLADAICPLAANAILNDAPGNPTYFSGVHLSATGTALAVPILATTANALIALGVKTKPARYQNSGGKASGLGTETVVVPTGYAAGDLLVILISTPSTAATPSPPAGWTALTGNPQPASYGGGVPDADKTTLRGYWKIATGVEAGVNQNIGADYLCGQMLRFSNVNGVTPIDVQTGDGEAVTATTVAALPGVTTTGAKKLIVQAVSTSFDSNTGQLVASPLPTNSALAAIAVPADANICTTTGNGGGMGIVTSVKKAAGATGTTTAALANASMQGRLTFAVNAA